MLNDIRYHARALRRTPVFTAIAIVSLALGIGASTAVFSVVDALLLRPLPVRDPGSLVTLEQVLPDGSRSYNLSYLDRERFEGLSDQKVFDGVAATTWADGFETSAGAGEAGERLRISIVTGNYFHVLGVRVMTGRALLPGDDQASGEGAVAVISGRYAARRFGTAADAVGRTIGLNGTTYSVVGVASAPFVGDWVGWPTDVWVPTAMTAMVRPGANASTARLRMQYKLIARRHPGVTRAQAQSAAAVVYQRMALDPPQYSGVIPGARLELVTADTGYSPQRTQFVQPLAVLAVIVGVVLLIACANTANLLLARASSRQREIAVRLAIGAGRARLVRQLLTESAMLAAAAALVGLLFAFWGTDMLLEIVRSGPSGSITSMIPAPDLIVRPDVRVLAFTIVLSFAASMLFGLAPAIRGSNPSLVDALARGATRGTANAGRVGPRRLLLAAQIATSVALLVVTGLFVRTLTNLRVQALGFDKSGILLVWMLPGQAGLDADGLLTLWRTLQERVSTVQGVQGASLSVEGILSGSPGGGPLVRIGTGSRDAVRVDATMTVGPGFFATVGQRMIGGRELAWSDGPNAPGVAVINESLARRLFGRGDAVGRRVRIGDPPAVEVVGVVGDARQSSPRTAQSMIYYPPGQNLRRLSRSLCLVVRTSGGAPDVATAIRGRVHEVDSRVGVTRIDTVDEQLDALMFQERLVARISVIFAGVALALTCIGLYGVIAFETARRVHEVGVRLSLGATPARVVRMLLRDGWRLIAAGLAFAIPLTLLSARLVANRLFGVEPFDPVTIFGSIALTATVCVMAAFGPAWRLSRVHPIGALRCE